MFEKVWKPYFDTWTKSMGDLLEKYFRSPSTLQGVTGALNTTFKGKKLKDKAMYLMLTTAGLPSYRDQKRLLHLMTRFGAQLEDLEEKVERLSQSKPAESSTEEQMAQLLARLDTRIDALTTAQEASAKSTTKAQKAAAKAEASGAADLSAQFEALHARLDALAAGTAAVSMTKEAEATPKAAAKKSTTKKTTTKKSTTKAAKSTSKSKKTSAKKSK